MKTYIVRFFIVENGVVKDKVATVSAENEYVARLLVLGKFNDARIDCDNIAELVNL